jgi:hypothetical protein
LASFDAEVELVALAGGELPGFQILAFHFVNGDGLAVIDMQKKLLYAAEQNQQLCVMR